MKPCLCIFFKTYWAASSVCQRVRATGGLKIKNQCQVVKKRLCFRPARLNYVCKRDSLQCLVAWFLKSVSVQNWTCPFQKVADVTWCDTTASGIIHVSTNHHRPKDHPCQGEQQIKKKPFNFFQVRSKFSSDKHWLCSSGLQLPASEVSLNLWRGDKLQLQEVQSAVPHALRTEEPRFKRAENYGKSLWI